MEEVGFIVGVLFGFFVLGGIFEDSQQDIIEKFQQPQCIEVVVGLHKIKKCYVINEVQE